VHLESAFPFAIMDPQQASSFRAGQALSLRQAPRHTERHKKSRLAFFVSLAVKDGELSKHLIDSVESTHHWGTPDRSKAVPQCGPAGSRPDRRE